jgi:TRIAP1/MDM35 family protein
MNSLSTKCQQFKEKYDACFNSWFSEKFLKGNYENDCEEDFKIYQKCVKEAIAEQKIEIWEMNKDEFKIDSSSSSNNNKTK